MLDYVKTKNRQGIFFTKPEEKIHLPDGAELVMRSPDQRFYKSFVIFLAPSGAQEMQIFVRLSVCLKQSVLWLIILIFSAQIISR